MPVRSCIKAPRTTGRRSADSGDEFEHFYTVTCTVGTDEIEIVEARQLPRLGQLHPKRSYLSVVNLEPQQVSQIFWNVRVIYGVPNSDVGAGSNPLLLPPVVSYETLKYEEEIFADIKGTPFKTVNGEPLSNFAPVYRRFSDKVMVIEKNVASFNQWAWEETVNSDWFAGAPPGHALLDDVTARGETANGISYFRRVAKVYFSKRGWRITRLHMGTLVRVRQAGGGTEIEEVIATAFDDLGDPIRTPVLLNERGFQIGAPSSTAKPPFYGNHSYLNWRIYPEASLNQMRLFG